MFMSNLQMLHKSMLTQLDSDSDPIEHQIFRSQHQQVVFECIFSISISPYKLSLTSRGTTTHPNAEFFLFDVSEKYEIANYFGDMYSSLSRLLRTNDGASGNRLIPYDFLTQLNANTPTQASTCAIPTTDRILHARNDISEDREKRFFSHWRTPQCKADGSPGQVSEANRQKTATISSAALAYSDLIGKSSCWSPIPTGANWRSAP